nr:NSP3 [Rotavirus A]
MLKMETTQQLASSMINSAREAAIIAAVSTLELMGIDFDRNEVESRVRQKFDYTLEDSGVKNNILGKAFTVDQALNGKLGSAIRNRNWMTNSKTVDSLDFDVNKLRMMCSSKGINQKMRVLNACFNVRRDNARSSSIISCNKLMFDKIQRGEVEIDDSLLDGEVKEENRMDVQHDTTDWKSRYEHLNTKYNEMRKQVTQKYDAWVHKARKVNENMVAMQHQVLNLQRQVQELTEQNNKLNLDFKDKVSALTSSLEWYTNSMNLDSEIKQQLIHQISLIDLNNPLSAIDDLEQIIRDLLTDYEHASNMVIGLIHKCGLEYGYE